MKIWIDWNNTRLLPPSGLCALQPTNNPPSVLTHGEVPVLIMCTRTHHANHWFEKFLPRNIHPCHLYGAGILRRTWSQEVFHHDPGVVAQWPSDLKMARMTEYKTKLITDRHLWNANILFYTFAPQQPPCRSLQWSKQSCSTWQWPQCC